MSSPTQPNTEPIPGYRLIERLGRGGYGEVWKCEAPGGIHKAIKFVFGDMEGFGDSGQAAEQEYKSLNRVKTIRHPFILSLERFDIVDGQLLIIMELADRNLWDRFNECILQGKQGIPHEELLKYMEEAAEALDLMNGHYQIQHLDIKPQNLFLVHQHIKVADFGLAKDLDGAKADVTGGVTPTYAPPETFEGWVSRHSDQYSLAIVYQEMLTGRRPFNGSNTRQLILQHLSAAPDLGTLKGNDREAVARALSKTPTDRFPTCTDFVKALRGQVSVTVPTEGPTEPLSEMVTPRSTAKNLLPNSATPPLNRQQVEHRDPTIKKLPSLVTPSQRSPVNSAAPITNLRPLAPDTSAHPKTSHAPPERHGEGVLFPALIVGLGGCGLQAIARMREVMYARFDRDRLPNLRWLAIDTDPAMVEAFLHGGAWETDEVVLTRLQRPSHYLNREGLPSVEGWLPNDSLYQLPRSHLTEGIRAYGRLALCDHYQLLCHRIRGVLEHFLKPESLLQADKLTQLGFRSNMPQVFLVGSLGGGTASGMMIDLAYIIRRELRQMGFGTGQVHGIFGLPSQNSSPGYFNAKATLKEISYFESPATTYQANFDTREQPIIDKERPFRRFHLIPSSNASTGARSLAEQIAAILHSETLTPIGKLAHPDGSSASSNSVCISTVARTFWPHHVIVRACTNEMNRQILSDWSRPYDSNIELKQVDKVFETVWKERELQPIQIQSLLEQAVHHELGTAPNDLISDWLHPLLNREKNSAPEVEEVLHVVYRILDLVGRVGREEDEHPGKLASTILKREREFVAETDAKLITTIVSLIEQPELRLLAADTFIHRLESTITDHLEATEQRVSSLEDRVYEEYARLFSLMGITANSRLSRKTSAIAEALRDVSNWVRYRYELLVMRKVLAVYRTLRSNIPEYIREVQLCRNQLRDYLEKTPDLKAELQINGEAGQFYFGENADDLKSLVGDILTQLPPEARRELEHTIQAKIRHEGRGLVNMCVKAKEHEATFLNLMKEQTKRLLGPLIVAYSSHVASWHEEGPIRISSNFETSNKLFSVLPGGATPAVTVVGIPAGNEHDHLLNLAKSSAGGTAFVSSETRGELWVFREARSLDPKTFLGNEPSISGSEQPQNVVRHSRKDVPWPKT